LKTKFVLQQLQHCNTFKKTEDEKETGNKFNSLFKEKNYQFKKKHCSGRLQKNNKKDGEKKIIIFIKNCK
jgi:hypothetical protein